MAFLPSGKPLKSSLEMVPIRCLKAAVYFPLAGAQSLESSRDVRPQVQHRREGSPGKVRLEDARTWAKSNISPSPRKVDPAVTRARAVAKASSNGIEVFIHACTTPKDRPEAVSFPFDHAAIRQTQTRVWPLFWISLQSQPRAPAHRARSKSRRGGR